jgi:glycosyltransferase involved in cell wall biosynthesis
MSRVLYLDPYHGPSHAALSAAYAAHSRHQVTLFTLPPRKWKWRMRGAALAFEPRMRALARPPEALIATDMLNVPELLALLRDALPSRLPVLTYFHENQITYPLPRRDERDFHFGLANIYTALASDLVVFNSAFHRDEFLAAIPSVIGLMPDFPPEDPGARLAGRSRVLGVPVDVPAAEGEPRERGGLIAWNHRWEEDKGPDEFFAAMEALDARGADFKIAVLGQSFREQPACFERARQRLAHRIAHWGYLPERRDYLAMLARCRVVVSTARHEFYGLAVREAIAAGCYPLLPHRVVYPELVEGRTEHLWRTQEELVDRLAGLMARPAIRVEAALRARAASPTPQQAAGRLDAWIDELVR